MKKIISSSLLLGMLTLTSFSGFAQESEDKVKIDVTVTQDGETKKIVKEIDLSDIDNLKELMKQVEGLEDINISIEEGNIEVIVKKTGELEKVISQNFQFPNSFAVGSENSKEKVPFMGVIGHDQDGEVVLSSIIEGKPAEEAGFKKNDIIKEFDGEKVDSYMALVDLIHSKEIGEKVKVKIERDGKKKILSLDLGERVNHHSFMIKSDNFNWKGNLDEEMEKLDQIYFTEDSYDSDKGFLGVHFNMDGNGVPITKIVEGSAAEMAKLMAEDIIIKVNGKKMEDGKDFTEIMKDSKFGDKVELVIERDGKTITKNVELGKRSKSIHVITGSTSDKTNFKFDNNFFESDNVVVKIKIMKVTSEEKKLVNKALGLSSSQSFDNMDINIYPNPTEGKFNIEAEVEGVNELEVSVFDLKGSEILKRTLSNDSGAYETELDITEYPSGTYFLVLRNENRTFTEKIVKK